MSGPPRPGDVLTIPPEHCLYATSDLRMRVVHVPPVLAGAEWVRLVGVRLGWRDREAGPVDVLVRASALADGTVRRERPAGPDPDPA